MYSEPAAALDYLIVVRPLQASSSLVASGSCYQYGYFTVLLCLHMFRTFNVKVHDSTTKLFTSDTLTSSGSLQFTDGSCLYTSTTALAKHAAHLRTITCEV